MKRKHIRRNKSNIFTGILFLLLCYFLYDKGYLNSMGRGEDFHQSLLTVNTIFLGFLFTALGIMVGFTDKDLIKSLDAAGYMDNYYNSIYLGMIFLGISTIISTIAVVLGKDLVQGYILITQQIGLLGGVLFFIKSIIGIMRIIKNIREGVK